MLHLAGPVRPGPAHTTPRPAHAHAPALLVTALALSPALAAIALVLLVLAQARLAAVLALAHLLVVLAQARRRALAAVHLALLVRAQQPPARPRLEALAAVVADQPVLADVFAPAAASAALTGIFAVSKQCGNEKLTPNRIIRDGKYARVTEPNANCERQRTSRSALLAFARKFQV